MEIQINLNISGTIVLPDACPTEEPLPGDTPVPTSTAAPGFTGDLVEGGTLTFVPGEWDSETSILENQREWTGYRIDNGEQNSPFTEPVNAELSLTLNGYTDYYIIARERVLNEGGWSEWAESEVGGPVVYVPPE
jgi:hypothetical protein